LRTRTSLVETNVFFLWPLEGMTTFYAVEKERSLTPTNRKLQSVSQLIFDKKEKYLMISFWGEHFFRNPGR